MSKSTKHAYEVVEVNNEGGAFTTPVEIGSHLVDKNHVRKHHEPHRSWEFLNANLPVGSENPFSYIVGKHIGEYEKVKHLLAKKGQ